MHITEEIIKNTLGQYNDPYLGRDPVSSGCIKNIHIQGGSVKVKLELNYAANLFMLGWSEILKTALLSIDGVVDAQVSVKCIIQKNHNKIQEKNLDSIKNIIAIASGKGGVGKSTTAVNLALALARDGASVGILDADIYGPSQDVLLGVPPNTKLNITDKQKIIPLDVKGIKLMSMAFFTGTDAPVIWRGPKIAGALLQLMTQTQWGQLDYLIVDMPPGTGDIQLTLAQKIPVAGAVIVTTPQDLALQDVKKSIVMFGKVNIPITGVIENMSMHTCSACGHTENVFGEGGGEKLAELFDVELLASLPLSPAIRLQSDAGVPIVIADTESQLAMIYQDTARKISANVSASSIDNITIPITNLNE
ncbi:UNVERIFIED_CONTAM: hypothetical protein GTU68_062072 [Idotea baltica]|nr:hypothetical protein [Idotea baltica]